jgi:predicted nucleic acid-binding Zn ribbon protein
MTVCLWCGETFPTTRYRKQYCNDDCRRYAYDKIKRDRKNGVMRDGKVCAICGKPITTERNRKYCSTNCREIGERERYQFNLAKKRVKREGL